MGPLLRYRTLFCTLASIVGLLFHWTAHSKEIRIALVLDKGGKDDRSFNASAYQGVKKAEKELNSFIKVVEATDDNAFEPLLRSLSNKKKNQKYDLLIAVGFSQVDAVNKIAKRFPEQKFAIVDAVADPANVRSLIFEEHEGSYLVGAIAALTSKTGKLGFIGGIDIPLIRRFSLGFEAGAKGVRPDIRIVSNYIGIGSEAWNNPTKAKELAMTQYDSGVDVIFGATGSSEIGIFDAAEEKKKFAIGVDSNQNGIKPGYILTSMVKHVDQAVFETCKDVSEGRFTGGVQHYGLSNGGIGFVVDQDNEKILPQAARSKADELKSQIISGKINVPDYYKLKK